MILSSDSLVTTEDLDAALEKYRPYDAHTRGRMRRAIVYILEALQTGADVETYAQIAFGFWYKVFFFTPAGALKSDTGGEHLNRKSDAMRIIKSQDLHRVPLSAVLENWDMGDLHTYSKPLSALLLAAWQRWKATYYQQQDTARRLHR